jgi:O-antigen/teichoic acid export membrane protein
MTSPTLAFSEPEQLPEDRSTMQPFARKALESRAIRATLWTVTDYGCSMALRVANSVILTRLLMPESFGLMTLVSTLVVGISLFADIGMGPNVIQSPRGDDPVFLNTVWTVEVFRGLGIFVVCLFLAWPMSRIYHEPRLISLIPAMAFGLVVSGFKSTNLLSMARHMGVRRVFVLDFTTQIFGLLVTAGCALVFKSVWALVIGALMSGIYRLMLSHSRLVIPGIRNSFCWDRVSVQSLVHFGRWILLSTAFSFFAAQADRLILGRLISFSLLGVYGIAYSVSDIPRAVISAFSNRVGFPFVAKMSHLPIDEFRKAFLQYRFRVLIAGSVLLCLMTYTGGILITKMYDSRYHAASWMVSILALGLWHTMMYSTTMPALLSLGKSRYQAVGNGAYFVTAITSIPLAFHFYGMVGAVVAVATSDLPMYIVTVMGASREGVSTWKQDAQATVLFSALLGMGLVLHALAVH